MSIRTFALPAALLCALAIQPALAADPVDGTTRGKGMPTTMTVEQATQRANAHATAMDSNQDGVIDADEFAAFHERQRAERMKDRFARFDTNGDGKVTVEEFVAARTARMATLDTDGDGVISPEEFRAGRGKMQRDGGSHQRKHRRGMNPAVSDVDTER